MNMNSEAQHTIGVSRNREWGLARHRLSKIPFNVKGGSPISNKYVGPDLEKSICEKWLCFLAVES